MSDEQTKETEKETWVMTYRVVADVEDEVAAVMLSEHIRTELEDLVDEDEGDTVSLMQVAKFGTSITPAEMVSQLRICRNMLVRTRVRRFYDLGQQLHEAAHILEHDDGELLKYDYSGFMRVAERILKKGENPTE